MNVRGSAFGLDLEGAFVVPGLLPTAPGDGRRPCLLELTDRAELDADWPTCDTVAVLRQRSPAGGRAMDADRDAYGRWRAHMHGVAVCLVEADGTRVRCAPDDPESPKWGRFLAGQALPLAAVLQGLEPFHASAVTLDGRAVGFVGSSYAGKTTVALALVLRGARLVTDDVLVVEAGDHGVRAHAGAAITNVRHDTVRLLSDRGVEALGREVSRDEHGVRLAVELDRTPRPLAILYYLERRLDRDAPAFETLRAPDPRLLLGASFNLAVQAPARLARQLDVCWRIARTATIVRTLVPAGLGPVPLARAIQRDARERRA